MKSNTTSSKPAGGKKSLARTALQRIALLAAVILILLGALAWIIKSNSHIETVKALDGITEKYQLFGKLIAERHYKNGKLNGITKTYDGQGRLKTEFNFVENRLEGVTKYYRPDGKPLYEDAYEDGKKVSRKRYDASGNMSGEEKFKK